MSDEEWPDPEPSGFSVDERVKVRIACSAAVALVFVVVFWDFLVAVAPRLWPPRTPLSRWATLVLIQAFGFVLLPVSIGSYLGDRIYERFLVDEKSA